MHNSYLHMVWTDFLEKVCIPSLGLSNFRVKHSSVIHQGLHKRTNINVYSIH
jgi:hypothetical protein